MAQMVQNLYNAGVSQFSKIKRVEEVCNVKDEESQPVYTMMELAQECSRSPQDASAIADLLLKKVSGSTNPIVKYKALRAIKYIAEKSTSSYFKKACGGVASGPIREALKFSGPMDPILGNTLNQRVRESAQACLDEVFKASAPGHGAPAAANTELQGRIQGYGSTTGATIVKPTTNPSKYQGFGNPAFSNGASSSSSSAPAVPPSSDYAVGLMSSTPAPESYSPAPVPTPSVQHTRAAAASLVGDEASLVAEMCAASGMRAQPHPDQLKLFVDKVSLMDPDVLAVELTGYLDGGANWQSTVRALCALEAVATAAAVPGADANVVALAGIFRSTPDSVQACAEHPQIPVRPRAAKCLAALGVAAGAESTQAPAAALAPPAAIPDLLGGLDSPPRGAQPPDALADLMGPPAPAAAADDMFSGMTSAPAPSAGADPFGGMTAAPAPVDILFGGMMSAPPVAGTGGDLFSGMTLSPAGAPTSAAPAARERLPDMFSGLSVNGMGAAAPARPSAAVDLLADLASPSPAQAGAQPPAMDMFADMMAAPAATPAAQPWQHVTNDPTSTGASAPGMPYGQGPGGGMRPALHGLPPHGHEFPSQGMPGMPNPYGGYAMHNAPPAQGMAYAPSMAQGPGMAPGIARGMPVHYGMQGFPGMPAPSFQGMQGQYGLAGMQQASGMLAQGSVPMYGAHDAGAAFSHDSGTGSFQGQVAPPAAMTRGITKTKDAFDFVNDEIKKK